MALISSCTKCGVSVSHRASEIPYCDECSGRNAAKRAEEARWKALSIEEKLDELKARLDALSTQSRWDGVIG